MRRSTAISGLVLLVFSLVMLTGCHRFPVPANARTEKIALKSYHGRVLTALGKGDEWLLRQEPDLSDCGWFVQYDLGDDGAGNRRVALESCHGRFLTAPRRGTARLDRQVWQESTPGDCGQFTLQRQGDGRYAVRTCTGSYITAGDAGVGWEPPLQWAVIVENPRVEDWEKFTILTQK